MSEKQKETPPKLTISVGVKFNKKLMMRQSLINLAADVEAEVTMKCMKDHDEIIFTRNAEDATDVNSVIESFDDIRTLTSNVLAVYLMTQKPRRDKYES